MGFVFWLIWNVSKPCNSSAFVAAIPAVETSFYSIHVKKDNRRNVNNMYELLEKKLEEKGGVKYSFVFAFCVKALTTRQTVWQFDAS